MDGLQRITQALTFVVKNILLEEEADLVSTGDEILSVPLQDRTLTLCLERKHGPVDARVHH